MFTIFLPLGAYGATAEPQRKDKNDTGERISTGKWLFQKRDKGGKKAMVALAFRSTNILSAAGSNGKSLEKQPSSFDHLLIPFPPRPMATHDDESLDDVTNMGWSAVDPRLLDLSMLSNSKKEAAKKLAISILQSASLPPATVGHQSPVLTLAPMWCRYAGVELRCFSHIAAYAHFLSW